MRNGINNKINLCKMLIKFQILSAIIFFPINNFLYSGELKNNNITSGSLDSFTVSGTVSYLDSIGVSSGYVKALEYDTITYEIKTVDSTEILPNGTYTLTKVASKKVYIVAYPDDEDFYRYIATYFPSTTDWQSATLLDVNGNKSNVNIEAQRTYTDSEYEGTISGNIYYSGGDARGTIGLNNAFVYAKIGSSFKSLGVTDSEGNFIIRSLDEGNYTLIINRIGFDDLIINNVTLDFSSDTSLNIGAYNIDPIVTEIHQNYNIKVSNYNLIQNYPNPFNPVTTIKYEIPVSGYVILKVHNIIGNEVMNLIDGINNTGAYEVIFNGINLSSGVYFYKIEVMDLNKTELLYSSTRRMILLK